ncbi:MAG TPA: LpqB family beta-propeller domain-containing protein [Acidimicrobiales bacterium]
MRRRLITAAMCAGGRSVAEPRLSPDGSVVAFVAGPGSRLAVVPSEGGPELVVTSEPLVASVAAYAGGAFDWVPGGDSLVYAGAEGGLYHVAASGGPSRVVAEGEAVASPAVSPDGTRVAYVVDGRHVAVASLAEDGPWPVRLSTVAPGPDFAFDPAWSPDGSRVAWMEWDVPQMPWDGARIVSAPADGGAAPVVVAGSEDVAVSQPRFSPDGSLLAFLSDAAGWSSVWVAAPDGTGPRALIEKPPGPAEHGDPSWGPGQRTFAWAPDGSALAVCQNESGFGRLLLATLDGAARRELGTGVHGGLSWIGDRLAAVRSGPRMPTRIVVLDPVTGGETVVARGPVGGFEEADLVEPELVEWEGPAVDGLDAGRVHGRLYRPSRPLSDPPPLLVWIHGGPTGQMQAGFNARVAFFVDRGWAVLAPDYRGSTGWGRSYAQALQGRWGELDVADTAAGMRAAADRGWGDPRRMVPIGGSAGGFTVLLLLALHPDLSAAGVDLYGVADLLELDETTHRFEAHYLHGVVGPLPATVDRYRERSPVNLADRIRAPLLILQGSADKVVPPAQSAAVAAAVRAQGGVVEHHVYEDEGHGWSRPETVADELGRIESFLRRHVLRWRV